MGDLGRAVRCVDSATVFFKNIRYGVDIVNCEIRRYEIEIERYGADT